MLHLIAQLQVGLSVAQHSSNNPLGFAIFPLGLFNVQRPQSLPNYRNNDGSHIPPLCTSRLRRLPHRSSYARLIGRSVRRTVWTSRHAHHGSPDTTILGNCFGSLCELRAQPTDISSNLLVHAIQLRTCAACPECLRLLFDAGLFHWCRIRHGYREDCKGWAPEDEPSAMWRACHILRHTCCHCHWVSGMVAGSQGDRLHVSRALVSGQREESMLVSKCSYKPLMQGSSSRFTYMLSDGSNLT